MFLEAPLPCPASAATANNGGSFASTGEPSEGRGTHQPQHGAVGDSLGVSPSGASARPHRPGRCWRGVPFGCRGDLASDVPRCVTAASCGAVAWSWDPPGSNVWGHAAVSGGPCHPRGKGGWAVGWVSRGLTAASGSGPRLWAGCAGPDVSPTQAVAAPSPAAPLQESLCPAMAALKRPLSPQ